MLEQHLKKHFNFSEFRPGQKEIVQSILDGKDVVALMPTGGGKSLCYQLPAIISGQLSIVISPLIALMKDQVDALNARGIGATFINSSMSAEENKARLDDIKEGRIKILYIAPERFASPDFQRDFSQMKVQLLAVDEAHCVSQWGHDFRPDYLNIKKYIDLLKERPVIAAFTATATAEVKEDIIERLKLQDPAVFTKGFDRPNLKFFVQSELKPKERKAELLRIVKSLSGSGIVYSLTRKNCDEIARELNASGISAVAYHAGLSGEARSNIQNEFMENRYKVIVATIAFGMGVDKSDIRFVIHCGMPASLEGYYQEAGRAGRDGEMAYCMLLHSRQDNATHNFLIQLSKTDMLKQGKDWEEVNRVISIKYDRLEKMKEYVYADICRRKIVLKYFDDPQYHSSKENCGGCDMCLNWKKKNENSEQPLVKKERKSRSQGELSGTILETVELYGKGYDVEKIAKIRTLGVSTILGHLIAWYASGGDFKLEQYLSPEEEKEIFAAMSKMENNESLSQIKQQLPDSISYEQIKMVIAKVQRIKL